MITIRKGKLDDLELILDMLRCGRDYMRQNGNYYQWEDMERNRRKIIEDTTAGTSYMIYNDDELVGVFTLCIGIDPTYVHIDGKWLDDSEYGTIHRIASNGKIGGIFKIALEFSLTKIKHLRVDTHRRNKPFKKLLLANGFKRTGIITIDEGTHRDAYELIVK